MVAAAAAAVEEEEEVVVLVVEEMEGEGETEKVPFVKWSMWKAVYLGCIF